MAVVFVTAQARRELAELGPGILARMDRLLGRLEQWPVVSGAKPLRGKLKGKFRLRTGDYRVQFHVETAKKMIREKRTVKGKEMIEEKEIVEHTVVVETVGHRDGFYDE